MTEYVLSLSKWRCGQGYELEHNVSRGDGWTKMLNSEGFMCCLGQFASPLCEPIILLNESGPAQVANGLNSAYDKNFISEGGVLCNFSLTQLAFDLVKINDGPLPVPMKLHRIKTLLKEHGQTLKVIQ